jgi:hypothetical protein
MNLERMFINTLKKNPILPEKLTVENEKFVFLFFVKVSIHQSRVNDSSEKIEDKIDQLLKQLFYIFHSIISFFFIT